MSERLDNVAKRYRELAREEPPAALDAAILAASRRAVARPSLARRWAAPVSIAAVLVLGFGLTLEMQQDKRSEPLPVERSSAPAMTPPAAQESAQQLAPEKPAAEREAFTPAPKPMRSPPVQAQSRSQPLQQMQEKKKEATAQKEEARADLERRPAPAQEFAAAPAAAPAAIAPAPPESAPAAPPARAAAADSTTANRAEAFAGARAKTLAAPSLDEELERIAKLRAQGRHEEADKALAEFRAKHPEFRIPDATWERVKPRQD